MKRTGFSDIWRGRAEAAMRPRIRSFGTARSTLRQRLSGVLSPASLFRLIIAFVLSTALWLYVNRGASDASLLYPQPIQVTGVHVPPGLIVQNVLPAISVNLKPLALGVGAPPASCFLAFVDLSHAHYGVNRLPVHLAGPNGHPCVPFASISPRTVSVQLDKLTTKSVPVVHHTTGTLPRIYLLKQASWHVTPAIVSVRGPKSFVDEVNHAVAFVPLRNTGTSINYSAVPVLQNAQGKPLVTKSSAVVITPAHVHVQATIQSLSSFRALSIVPTFSGQPAAGFGITAIHVEPSGITIFGPPGALNGIDLIRTSAVNVAGLKAGAHTFVASLIVPSGARPQHKTSTVQVVVGPIPGTASTRRPVVPINVTQGYEVTSIQPASVLVTASGPATILQSGASKVQLQVDLTGLITGTYPIAPAVQSPAGVRVDSILPQIVRVTIEPKY